MDYEYTELLEKLTKLQWLLRRLHMKNHFERGPSADPSQGQGRVLAMLRIQPEISSKDLSYLLGIRQQSLNELLNKLEKAEYVVRTPSEADRRVMIVQLTEKGKAAEQGGDEYADIFNCLSSEEQDVFADHLDRIIAALENRIGTDMSEEEREHWREQTRGRRGGARPQGPGPRRGGSPAERHRHGFAGFEAEGSERGVGSDGRGPGRRGIGPQGRKPRRPRHPQEAQTAQEAQDAQTPHEPEKPEQE